jgi:hypothetical protein
VGPVTRTGNSEINAKFSLKKETGREILDDQDIEGNINLTRNLT